MVESVSYGKKPLITLVNESLASGGNTVAAGAGVGAGGTEDGAGVQAQPYSYLVSGSRDKSIRLWDPLKGECLGVYGIHDNWVRAVHFHPTHKYVISCSDDRSVKVLDIKEGRCIRSIADAHSHFVTCVALPPHGLSSVPPSAYKVVISGSVDKHIHVWGCS